MDRFQVSGFAYLGNGIENNIQPAVGRAAQSQFGPLPEVAQRDTIAHRFRRYGPVIAGFSAPWICGLPPRDCFLNEKLFSGIV